MSYLLKRFIKGLMTLVRRSSYPLQAWNANATGALLQQKGQVLELTSAPAIVFAPHQDDESLGCGGLLAQKQAIGAAVQVVFMTDGAFSRDARLIPAITEQRQQEALTAMETLGIDRSKVTFLNYPDGSLRQLDESQRIQILGQLKDLLHHQPQADVFVPHHQDCHPDHEATCDLVRQALLEIQSQSELWQYPVWAFWKKPLTRFIFSAPKAQAWYYLPISDAALSLKQQAITCHVSQMTALPPGFLRRFQQPYELFWKLTL